MAVQANKTPPENRSYNERIVDFSGGLNTTISGSLLNSNEAQIATDISMEQKGTIRPRRGRTKRYATPFATAPVTGLGVYYKNDGTSRLLMASGSTLYKDSPHMSDRWDTKADFEQDGTTLSGFASLTEKEGSVTARKQYIGDAAHTDSAPLWSAKDAVLSVNTGDSAYDGDSSLEVLIDTGKTDGFAYIGVTPDTSKYVALTAYVKNGNATSGIRLVGLTSGGSVSVSSAYSTATGWTKLTLKLSPEQLLLISSFGVQATGAAGQTAYFCGLFYEYITDVDYNNSGFVPHDLSYYDAMKRTVSFNDYAVGTHSNTVNNAGALTLGVEIAQMSVSRTTMADFDLGTKNGTSSREILDAVVLARQE